ncbi:MAG: hypothetical protein QXT26_03210 [Thermoproteota archaeon]
MENRFAISIMLILLMTTILLSHPPIQVSYSEPTGVLRPYEKDSKRFLVTVGETNVTIAVVSEITEEFKIIINSNGGISNIMISQINFTGAGGWFVWERDWQQVYGSNSTAPPIVEEKPEYVVATFFGRYNVHPLDIVTKITVSKNGLILIDSNLTAIDDATDINRIGWGLWEFPVSLFGGSYVDICREGTVIKAKLPAEYTPDVTIYDTSRMTYWMDFSTLAEGITMINIAPSLFKGGFGIGDNRGANETYTNYNAHFRLTEFAKGAMKKGDVKTVRIALYIHGPGGYEGNRDMIDLIVELGKAEDSARNMMASYKDPSAKEVAYQAFLKANSAFHKLIAEDVEEAKTLLRESLELMRRAEELENKGTMTIRTLQLAIPLVLIITIFIAVLLVHRRKKSRGKA